MGETMEWAEFAMLAEGHRRAGMLDLAEQLARSGLDEQPECAEGALVMALVLLDQSQTEEAYRVIADWAETNLGVEVSDEPVSGDSRACHLVADAPLCFFGREGHRVSVGIHPSGVARSAAGVGARNS